MSRRVLGSYALLVLGLGIAVPLPVLAAELVLPRECVTAELEGAEKIRGLLARGDRRATWLLGGSLALMKAARGYCLNGRVDRALPLYQRMFEALHIDERARAPEVAATQDRDGPSR